MSATLSLPGMPPPPDASLSQYDTPRGIAERLVEWAGVESRMRVLEPSAGLGALALPAKRRGADVRCVEISPERCEVLRELGLTVTQGDFLTMPVGEQFDLVIMNPPYEGGQDLAHLLHALKFARRVVALLPLGTLDGVDRYSQLWARHGLRRMAVLKRRFKAPGSEHGGQRPFAVFEVTRDMLQPSTAVEWW